MGLDNLYPNLTDFYRDVIRMGFEYFSLDPNEHLDEMFTEEEEDSRKRSRFIKSAPKAKKPRTSPTQSVFDEEQFVSAQEDVEREYQYRLPVISENIVAEDPHADTVDHLSSDNLSIPVDPLVSIDPVEEAAKNSPESEPMLKALFQSFEQEKEVPIPQSALSLVWENCGTPLNFLSNSTLKMGLFFMKHSIDYSNTFVLLIL